MTKAEYQERRAELEGIYDNLARALAKAKNKLTALDAEFDDNESESFVGKCFKGRGRFIKVIGYDTTFKLTTVYFEEAGDEYGDETTAKTEFTYATSLIEFYEEITEEEFNNALDAKIKKVRNRFKLNNGN